MNRILLPAKVPTVTDHQLNSRRIVIAGGSGFLGVSLAHHLAERGAEVTILSRNPPRSIGPWKFVPWDGHTLRDWKHALNQADGLVNLVGRSVDCIKSPDHQDEILRSRVESTRLLGKAMQSVAAPPPVWVQMSTAHIYGDPPIAVCREDSPTGYGLAPFVARAWEQSFHDAVLPTQRQVILRTSFVIGRNRGAGAGAMSRLVPLAKLGLAGRIASGTQGISWIHEADLNQLFEQALLQQTMEGVYIASAPQPVSQVEFMRALRRAVGMPIGLPCPAWVIRLASHYVFRTDPELVLYGRYVIPQRLHDEGFHFAFPSINAAIKDLLS